MVDGKAEARPAHGRTVPIELCRTPQRGLPAMESQRQRQLIERPRKRSIAAQQRSGAGETTTPEVEEHVQEALHSLCSCSSAEPSCSSARETEGIGRSGVT